MSRHTDADHALVIRSSLSGFYHPPVVSIDWLAFRGSTARRLRELSNTTRSLSIRPSIPHQVSRR